MTQTQQTSNGTKEEVQQKIEKNHAQYQQRLNDIKEEFLGRLKQHNKESVANDEE